MIFDASQNIVKIQEIKNNMVILRGGEYKAILEINPINYGLKTELEQEAIIQLFEGFLNSLTYDVQILMVSRKIDIDDYLMGLQEYMKTEENPTLRKQMQNYINFLSNLVKERNLLQKKFYLIINYNEAEEKGMLQEVSKSTLSIVKKLFSSKKSKGFSDRGRGEEISYEEKLEKAREKARFQLNQRVASAINRLGSMGITARELRTFEIAELFYYLYNPSKANLQKLKKNVFPYYGGLAIYRKETY